MHAWINITHPGFSDAEVVIDEREDEWIPWEQMVATLRAKGAAEGRAALLAREVVELRGEVAKLKPLEFLLLKGGDPVQHLSEAVLDLSAKVRCFEEGAQINLRQLIEAREELESERANRNRIVSAIMDDAASGRLQVLAQLPVPKFGEEVREPGFVCIQNVWLDAGEVRKAAASLGMVEASAVVVPDDDRPSREFLENYVEGFDPGERSAALFGWREGRRHLRERIRTITPNRVLGEGMKFFWIDPVNFAFGFEESEAHARDRAEKAIEMENSEARLSEGIFEKESLGICYGIVLAKAAVSKEPKYNDFPPLILEPIRANQGGAAT